MKCENWSSCKDCLELALKVIFVGVFTWGVMSAVCCMKSCNTSCSTQTTCSKSSAVDSVKQCGPSCTKPCCKK